MSGAAPSGRRERRDVTINIRASSHLRDLIDRAAQAVGTTRSDFILETVRQRAEDVLLDQTVFVLDDEKYDAFMRLLERPAMPSARLRQLLAMSPPWQKNN